MENKNIKTSRKAKGKGHEALAVLAAFMAALSLASCGGKREPPRMSIDFQSARKSFGSGISISPMDAVATEGDEIIIAPQKEGVVYTVSGYHRGQIEVKTKDTVLKLAGAFIENTDGKAAVKATSKIEVSAAAGTDNYLVSTGRNFSRTAALSGKKSLVVGGSGRLFVSGNVCHGSESSGMKIKGSGEFHFQGTRKGSAISCETFEVEPDKDFTCFVLNSKNGIKADDKILIRSGNFRLYDNGTALKTELSRRETAKPRSITLSGGEFRLFGNGSDFSTDEGAFDAEGATIIDEGNGGGNTAQGE